MKHNYLICCLVIINLVETDKIDFYYNCLEKRNRCGDVEIAREPHLHGVCRLELLHEPGLPHPLHLHPGQLQGAGADGGGGQLRHQRHRDQQHGGQAYPGHIVTENEQVEK